MMKIKKIALFGIVMLFSIMTCTAQDKLFTLEELNFGGKNYRSLLPQNMWLTWWGDQLMYQDAEEGGTIPRPERNRDVSLWNKSTNYSLQR